jgi:hypothetical protein
MDCSKIEEQLSEYLEQALPAAEMDQIAKHLNDCSCCSSLLREMQSNLYTCRAFPSHAIDPDLVERILLRTTGRPRTRSFRESLKQYLSRPMLTPKFAVGTGLATLFLVLLINLLLPRMSTVASFMKPSEAFRLMDRGVQQLYGKGLKAYDKKNEWQAQFTYYRNNIVNKLGFIMEQLDIPVEGRKKLETPSRRREKSPNDKSSTLRLWMA